MAPSEVLMQMYLEHDQWARHFDTIRVGITAAIVAAATGGMAAALAIDVPRLQKWILTGVIIFSVLMTGLSARYLILYREHEYVGRKMLKYAVGDADHVTPVSELTTSSPPGAKKFDFVWLHAKVDQSFREAFTKKGDPVPETYEEWSWPKLVRVSWSSWFISNVGIGIALPVVLLIVLRQHHRRSEDAPGSEEGQ